jgi:hypothetical protein
MMGWKAWSKLATALTILIVIGPLVFSDGASDVHNGLRQNEAAAIGSLRRVGALERRYAAAHPDKGFACELELLRPAATVPNPYDPIEGLLNGRWSGYRFAFAGCTVDTREIVTHYQVMAVPVEPGKTGIRALCTDESGKVFYDSNVDSSRCLASKREIPD